MRRRLKNGHHLDSRQSVNERHHGKEFLGSAASAPPNWLLEWLFRYLFFPKMREKNGLPWQAPCGLRKIEAKVIDDLKDFKSLIIPLFFVPLGKLKEKNWFKREEMNELHKELLMKCTRHDLSWAKRIVRDYFAEKRHLEFLKPFYILFIKLLEWQTKGIAFSQ